MADTDWGAPETDVIESAHQYLRHDSSAMLATIVGVEGSAYRRPGAKMVIPPEGDSVGSITADCLEDEVTALARDVLADGTARIETYDLRGDGDVWGLGVGCNGVIDVLLEPIEPHYQTVTDAVAAGNSVAVCTVVESENTAVPLGTRAYYLHDDGWNHSDQWPDELLPEISDTATQSARDGNARTITVRTGAGEVEIFLDGIAPPPELVVLGTGRDIRPVTELGKRNGFRVIVIGFRGATATSERFPHADAIRSTSPDSLREVHDFDTDTYVVVMTHNFIDDRLALNELLKTQSSYIGLMGPRERFEEMRSAFAEEGRTFRKDELERVFTPAGLNLGSETPYQIAHSIIAELLAIHNDRCPRHLTNQNGPIHDRTDAGQAQRGN
ncbi:XdhC family protein (plasmid) [Haloarcula sp. NS06]|uniref:XdhC family protein n=1 Tax=Haloarcula sp. NS06 TaxID=3409688 RepID=UPI003DA73522